MGDPVLYRLSYLQRQGGEEQYDCEAVQQRTRGKEKRDFICAIFLSPAASFSAWLEKKKNRAESGQPLRHHHHPSINCAPLHAHTKPCCVQSPNTSVVSNLVLTPLNAHKQGLHPPPLTIWAPPPPRPPSWPKKNPFTTPLQPHTLETRLSVSSNCGQRRRSTAPHGGAKRDLRGTSCCSYLHFPVWYAYMECV